MSEDEELATWRDMSRRMFVPFNADGVISQFEGYDELEELDWDGYRERYGNVGRLDRILHAEGDDPNRYKVSKQADTLMLFFLFPVEELQRLLAANALDSGDTATARVALSAGLKLAPKDTLLNQMATALSSRKALR